MIAQLLPSILYSIQIQFLDQHRKFQFIRLQSLCEADPRSNAGYRRSTEQKGIYNGIQSAACLTQPIQTDCITSVQNRKNQFIGKIIEIQHFFTGNEFKQRGSQETLCRRTIGVYNRKGHSGSIQAIWNNSVVGSIDKAIGYWKQIRSCYTQYIAAFVRKAHFHLSWHQVEGM